MILPPNCYSKKRIDVNGAVIHFISARYTMPEAPFNLDEIIKILTQYKYSYKGLITREGEYIELVPENFKQYHAGYSIMNGRNDCNNFTNGYACFGGSLWPYPDDQIMGLSQVLAQDMTKNKYTLDYVQGHDEVRQNWRDQNPAKIAELKAKREGYKVAKKKDPGAHFPREALKDMLYSVSEANRV